MSSQRASSGHGDSLSLALGHEQAAIGLGARLRFLIRLGRPKYLLKSTLLYGLGATLALYRHQGFTWSWYLYGLLFVWCLHLVTHYCNEFFDLEADRANPSPTDVSGGSRVLADGILPPSLSLSVAFLLLFVGVALMLGMPTATARWMSFIIVLLSWFYTAPPLKLNYRALGELTATFVFDVLCPGLAFYLQARSLDPILGVVLLPSFIAQYAHMLMMNLLDHEGDQLAGKKTVVVALGPALASRLHILGHVLVYGSTLGLWWAGLPSAVVLLIWLTLPLSLWQARRVLRGEHRAAATKSSVGRWASIHTALVSVATTVGLLLSMPAGAGESGAKVGYLLSIMAPAIYMAFMLSAFAKRPAKSQELAGSLQGGVT
ncbi:prenyltransferase [Sorangium sp. So ce861]|uniref:prenyltransferase n=1 Tax=Sorangium sp. So ce861 TaxID=3133323 RepID=UPI003F606452